MLLFHAADLLDVNECALDFLYSPDSHRLKYMKGLYEAVVREDVTRKDLRLY